MKLIELNQRADIEQNKKLHNAYLQFGEVLSELNKKELPDEIVRSINTSIEEINHFTGSERELRKQIRRIQSNVLQLVQKECKLVPKNHYRNMWLGVGMAVFGIPIGVAFGASLHNMAFIGIGIPLGMVFGIAIGSAMDKKASKEGKQLNLEIDQ